MHSSDFVVSTWKLKCVEQPSPIASFATIKLDHAIVYV